MKKIIIVLVLFALMLSLAFYMISCGQSSSSSSSSSTTTASESVTFYAQASDMTPVFEPTASSSSVSSKATWGSGNPLYSVFFTLRAFLASRDEGVVDRSNLYKLLADIDTVYSGITGEVVAITEQAITPPFAAFSAITCDKAINNTNENKAGALKETTDEVDAIVTWIWTEEANPLKAEYGIATSVYDKSTKDTTVNMTYSVDNDTTTASTEYNLRCYVTGNRDQHAFSFKYIIGDTKIVAKGISKAGENMLFKYTDASGPTKYIVVPGDADEGFFSTQNTTPTAIYTDASSLPATVASYVDWVTGEAFFTASDLVDSTADLNIGNSQAGTIFLNYN